MKPSRLVQGLLLGASLALGCSSTVTASGSDGGADASSPCVFPNGSLCPAGATCPSPDGCNTCSCGPGAQLSCTERGCLPDAGPAQDVPRPVDVATQDAGRPDASPPTDSAVRVCQSTRDCPAGRRCVYQASPSCREGTVGLCQDPGGCESLPVAPQYCGCDGVTFTIPSACPPDRPFVREGPCSARDAGAPTDGPSPRYIDAVLTWQSPGGVAGWGPAVMVRGDGTVHSWRMARSFDPSGTVPTPDATMRLSTAVVDDLFARWERASIASLPHNPRRTAECYPSVIVQTCMGCMPVAIRYSHPTQLAPEMEEVWAWFDLHTPATRPRRFCDL